MTSPIYRARCAFRRKSAARTKGLHLLCKCRARSESVCSTSALMSQSPDAETEQPAVLGYHRPTRRSLGEAFDVPLRWWEMVILAVVATWPFILTATLPEARFGQPITGLFFGAITLSVAGVVWLIRCAIFRPPIAPTSEMAHRSLKRCIFVFGGSGMFILLHTTGLLMRLLFILHAPLFEAERQHALATMPPNTQTPHGWIGLFPITEVRRGPDGEIGFSDSTNCGFSHDPTPSTKAYLFVPPDDDGHLFGKWRWECTD